MGEDGDSSGDLAGRQSFALGQLGIAGDLPVSQSRPSTANLNVSSDLRKRLDEKILEQLELLASCVPELLELAKPNDLLGPVTLYRLGHARLFDIRTSNALTKPTDSFHVRGLLHTSVAELAEPRFRELEQKLRIGYAGWLQIYTTLRVFDATDGFRLVPSTLGTILKPHKPEQSLQPEHP